MSKTNKMKAPKKLLNTVLATLFLFYSSLPCFADYKSNVIKGNNAYKTGKTKEAIEFYEKALADGKNEKVSPAKLSQLENLISKLKLKVDEKHLTSTQWFLIGANIASIAGATYFGIDLNNKINNYKTLYNKINDINDELNAKLIDERSKIENEKWIFIAFASCATFLSFYNMNELFFSDKKVSAFYNPENKTYYLAFNCPFK